MKTKSEVRAALGKGLLNVGLLAVLMAGVVKIVRQARWIGTLEKCNSRLQDLMWSRHEAANSAQAKLHATWEELEEARKQLASMERIASEKATAPQVNPLYDDVRSESRQCPRTFETKLQFFSVTRPFFRQLEATLLKHGVTVAHWPGGGDPTLEFTFCGESRRAEFFGGFETVKKTLSEVLFPFGVRVTSRPDSVKEGLLIFTSEARA